MDDLKSLLALLLESQRLDRVPRTGYVLRGVHEPESVAEHSWHVAFLVWTLSRWVPDLDTTRALELALVHDLAEVRIGDLPRTAATYFPVGAKQSAERAALEDLLGPLGAHALELVSEYESGESLEARFVRACDKLQLMLKVATYEEWGAGGLGDFWRSPDNRDDGGFPIIRRLYDQLWEKHEQMDRGKDRSGGPEIQQS